MCIRDRACGIDPSKATIFIQSQIPELCELSFYYMDLVSVSRLQRNPTVKSEIQMRNFEASIPVGFFTYPISQAADITAFRATTVPVSYTHLLSMHPSDIRLSSLRMMKSRKP